LPRGSEISDDAWRVSTPARIGDDCRLHGNIRAESITIGEETTVFGSLRARDDIAVGAETVIIGDVTTRGGTITLAAGAHVRGDVACEDLVVNEGAAVDGTLRARGEMKLVRQTDDPDESGGEADDESTGEDTASDDGDAVDESASDDGSDASQTGPKMAYTTATEASAVADDSDAAGDADDIKADEQPDRVSETGDSVGVAYTVGADSDADEPAVEDADGEPASETVHSVSAAYLVADGDAGSDGDAAEEADSDTGETADDADDEANDEADDKADDEADTDERSDSDTVGDGDDAVIIADAESDDIELGSDGESTNSDA